MPATTILDTGGPFDIAARYGEQAATLVQKALQSLGAQFQATQYQKLSFTSEPILPAIITSNSDRSR